MTYQIPDVLAELAAFMRRHGGDDFKTERQFAFMAQQVAGTRFKFPPKGESCFRVLQAIQKATPAQLAPATERAVHVEQASQRGGRHPFANAGKSGNKRGVEHRVDTSVPPGFVIYADGCCHPNPGIGGWGWAAYRDGVEIDCDCHGDLEATNQTMELTAAIQALYWINGHVGAEPVRLFSDSKYVVDGSNVWRHGWKAKGWRRKPNSPNGEIANLDLWLELDRMLTAIPIKLEWCKGHAGIVGNERADELSEMGRESVLPKSGMDFLREQLGEYS